MLAITFGPAQRANAAQVAAHHQELTKTPLAQQLLDTFPEAAMVLNTDQQIVLANDKLSRLLNVDPEKLLGARVGEVLNCVHARACGSRCGTLEVCTQCGAVQAIKECSRSQIAQVRECRITSFSASVPVPLDLRVWATPLVLTHRFTVFAIRDATDEKRRAVLERLFFHDVLNAAGGLKGIIEVLPDLAEDELSEMHQMAQSLAEELLEDIRAHRDLTAAERGDLAPIYKEIDAAALLRRLCVLYGHHIVAAGKTVSPRMPSASHKLYTDEVILSRVLGNLIKNALEASLPGQTVDVSFENSGAPVFSIHNESVIPANVQLQIFQRSFSTKMESGRGLGTYSAKLLAERYLKGTVEFTSSADRGTTFTVTLGGPRARPGL